MSQDNTSKSAAEKCAERLHEKGYLPHTVDIPIVAEIIEREYGPVICANNIAMMSAVERLERFHRVYGGCQNEIQKLKEQLK